MKTPRPAILAALALALSPTLANSTIGEGDGEIDFEAAAETIRAVDIAAHVDFLASDELAGRHAKSPMGRVAARYIATRFKAYGLEPLGDEGTYFQALEDEELAPNVVGILRGTGAGYVVLGAHFDHLKPRGKGEDVIYNGADDNASGTAAVLELAQAFASLEERPTASLVFIAFTGEELGLRGSRHFAKNPPFELSEVRGMVNLDMISRGEENLIFCEGGEQFPKMREQAERANQRVGLDLRFDEHPEWLGSSDHAPFMKAGVPTLYLGVEDHPDYHRVSDHPDRILAGLAEKVSRLTFWIAAQLAK